MAPLASLLPSFIFSLSARLLVLTAVFVMLAEFLIYAPSIGRYRLAYLEEHLAAAHLAVLALEATPDNMVSDDLEALLLDHAGAFSIALTQPTGAKLMLMTETPRSIDASFDLREAGFFSLIGDAFMSLAQENDRSLRVIGPSPKMPEELIEVVLDESPMRTAMIDYSWRILGLSLLISLITASLVFVSLHRILVGPMRRITASMVAFREAPEDTAHLLDLRQDTGTRKDEIGLAQRELLSMQDRLRAALQQKTRLAALGAGVTKINHDLRNILASALIVSDRLAQSDDPEVKRSTPAIVAAIERAVALCATTLSFVREGPMPVHPTRFDLRALLDDVSQNLPTNGKKVALALPDAGLEINADRNHLFRAFSNLFVNAIEAGAQAITVSATSQGQGLLIAVHDDGPGLTPRAREHLFQPFQGSARPGGSGLGLTIARELLLAHGGDLRLAESTGKGTTFELRLPQKEA